MRKGLEPTSGNRFYELQHGIHKNFLYQLSVLFMLMCEKELFHIIDILAGAKKSLRRRAYERSSANYCQECGLAILSYKSNAPKEDILI